MNKIILLLMALASPLLAAEKLALGGSEITVVGKITTLCNNTGCWADVMASDGKNLRLTVKDGNIVIPLLARGKMADATDQLTALKLSREQATSCLEHLEHDTTSVDDRN